MSLLTVKPVWTALTMSRVKSVAIHPSQALGYASCMNGELIIFNKNNGEIASKVVISNAPLRSVAVYAAGNAVVVGDDNGFIHLIDANTGVTIKSVKAHTDFVRCVIVHPKDNICISCGDDSLIRVWSLPDLTCTRGFDGHSHFVMTLTFMNQENSIVSGSLDGKIKVWDLKSMTPGNPRNYTGAVPLEGWYNPMFTLDGHADGVDCVASLIQADRTIIISGSDDKTVRAWDPITKECIVVLPSFNNNLTAVLSVPELGLFVTADEDRCLKFCDSNNFSIDSSQICSLDRPWNLVYDPASTSIIAACDRGIATYKLTVPRPPIALDPRSRKLLLVGREVNNEIISGGETIFMAQLGNELPAGDGVHFPIQWKAKSTLTGTLSHAQFSPNGQKIDAICGSEYVIITTLTGSTSQVGSCRGGSSAWSLDSKYFATISSRRTLSIIGQEERKLEVPLEIKSVVTGPLLTVIGEDTICLYDWNTLKIASELAVQATRVVWNNNCLVISTSDALFVIAIDLQRISMELQSPSRDANEAIANTSVIVGKLESEITDFIAQNDIIFFVNKKRQLCYAPISKPTEYRVHTLLSSDYDLLGYLGNASSLLLVNTKGSLLKYEINLTLIELMIYQDVSVLLPAIENNDNAAFNSSAVDILMSRGMVDEALRVCKLPEKLVEIYLSQGETSKAMETCNDLNPTKKEIYLSNIMSKAMKEGDWDTCRKAATANRDVETLFVLEASLGDEEEIAKVADMAFELGRLNIAFNCYYAINNTEMALKCLVESGELSSATFFAYHQQRDSLTDCFNLWKEKLDRIDPTISEALVTPETILAKEKEEDEAAAKAAREAEAEHVKEKVEESSDKTLEKEESEHSENEEESVHESVDTPVEEASEVVSEKTPNNEEELSVHETSESNVAGDEQDKPSSTVEETQEE